MLGRLFGKRDPIKEHARGVELDAAQLGIFRQMGTNMTAPRPVEHNFWAKAEPTARELAVRLASVATDIEVSRIFRHWGVECVVVMPLTEAAVAQQRARFEALALELGAIYDGWGTYGDAPVSSTSDA